MVEIFKLFVKYAWKWKKPEAKTIFKNNKVGGLNTTWFQTYHKTRIIKTAQGRMRTGMQINGTEQTVKSKPVWVWSIDSL